MGPRARYEETLGSRKSRGMPSGRAFGRCTCGPNTIEGSGVVSARAEQRRCSCQYVDVLFTCTLALLSTVELEVPSALGDVGIKTLLIILAPTG
jgi:hypothetical protein